MAEFEFVAVSRELCFHFRPVAAELIIEREREREKESSNYTAAGVILSRLRWASINFRKHVSMHVDRHFFFLLFNYRPANEIYIYIYILGCLYFSLLDFFFGFSNFNIYIKD